jgi:CRISPR type III-A-associated protein Csm2
VSRATVETDFRFDGNYLKGGYFHDPERKQLRTEIVDDLARNVAWVLSKTDIAKPAQLRRFFNQLRAVERSINSRRTFEEAKADIAALKPAVSRQVSRKLVGENFKLFIDRNVDLAVDNKENFMRGFIPHFSAVLGFFEYFKPEKKGE